MPKSNYKILVIAAILLAICLLLIYQKTSKCSADALYYTKQGERYYSEKKYDLAIDAYNKALSMGLEVRGVFFTLGLIYYQEKQDYKKAEEMFLRGLSLYPHDSLMHFFLSKLYFDMKEINKALEEYKLYTKYSKTKNLTINGEALRKVLSEMGKTDVEIAIFFKNIIEINPNDYTILFELAKYHEQEKQYSKALEEYKKVIELNPNMKMVYWGIGSCYYNLGQYNLALDYYKKSEESGYDIPDELFEAVKQKIR